MATSTRPRTSRRPTRTVRPAAARSSRSASGSSSPSPVWLFVIGGAVLLLLGFVVGTRAGGSDSTAAPTTTSVVAEFGPKSAGPRRYEGAIPVGFERSAAGATAAATAYLQAAVELLADGYDDAAAGLARITTPGGLTRMDQGYTTVFEQLRVGLMTAATAAQEPGSIASAGGAMFMHYTPVATRSVSFTNTVATVEVWGLAVLALDGAQAPIASWGTETITLVWDEVADDWRIDDWTAIEGPTPVWASTPAIPTADFLTRITQFSPLRAVPRP